MNGWLREGKAIGDLRGPKDWDGYVISDCGAIANIHATHAYADSYVDGDAMAMNNGCDIDCGAWSNVLNESVSQGLVSEANLATAVNRSVMARMRLGLFDPPDDVPFSKVPLSVVGSPEHLALSAEAAREAIVLVKNEDGFLPLRFNASAPNDTPRNLKIAVMGPNANDPEVVLGNYHGFPYKGKVVTPLLGIQARADAANKAGGNVSVTAGQGCWIVGEGSWQFENAISQARAADVAVIVVGSSSKGSDFPTTSGTKIKSGELDPATEKESLDRTSLSLPGVQEDLVKAIVKRTTTDVVVVLVNGGPLAIEPVGDSAEHFFQIERRCICTATCTARIPGFSCPR